MNMAPHKAHKDHVVEATGIKTLRQKADEIRANNEALGMDDPSTRAKQQAMDEAADAEENAPVALTEDADLVARRAHRDGPVDVAQVKISAEQKQRNEELSAAMNVDKAKDVKESEFGKPANIKK